MKTSDFPDQTNTPIQCPLKKSAIAWARCIEYRKKHGCLCPAAFERARLKGNGQEIFDQKLSEIKVPRPDRPPGWTVQKNSRFYVIHDQTGQPIHRASNLVECNEYLSLAATAQSLQIENKRLWKLLENELIPPPDPWEQLDQRLAAEKNAENNTTKSEPKIHPDSFDIL